MLCNREASNRARVTLEEKNRCWSTQTFCMILGNHKQWFWSNKDDQCFVIVFKNHLAPVEPGVSAVSHPHFRSYLFPCGCNIFCWLDLFIIYFFFSFIPYFFPFACKFFCLTCLFIHFFILYFWFIIFFWFIIYFLFIIYSYLIPCGCNLSGLTNSSFISGLYSFPIYAHVAVIFLDSLTLPF